MNDNSIWLSAYLYYAEPWEEFLAYGVKPFVDKARKNKWASQYFFIRYWEKGPHIRLRFKGSANIVETRLKSELISYFTGYFKKHPSTRDSGIQMRTPVHGEPFQGEPAGCPPDSYPNNSIQFMDYEPEVERYGGPEAILIAEKQFELSSDIILTLLQNRDNWPYERRMGLALELQLALLSACAFTRDDSVSYYSRIVAGSREYYPQVKENDLKEQYEKQKDTVSSFIQDFWSLLEENNKFGEDWINRWITGMKDIADQLKSTQIITPQTYRNPPLWYIIPSYIHMTNNRLGITNIDEYYLSYMCKNSLQSVLLF